MVSPRPAQPFHAVLRLALGGSLGLLVAKLTQSDSWGVFFTIGPVLLLGLLPQLTAAALRQYVMALVFALGMAALYLQLAMFPLACIVLVYGCYLWLFRLMAGGVLFVFAAISTINGSIFLHFASYPAMDFSSMASHSLFATLTSMLISVALYWYLPTPPPPARPAPPPVPVSHHLVHALLATSSFVLFQLLDLQDSLSAQASSILILLPLHYGAIVQAGLKRARGVLLGSAYAIACQLLLYSHYQQLLLVLLMFFFGMLCFAKAQQQEGPGSGVAFGAMTTMAIIFGQYLTASHDLMFSALYRISSVTVAVGLTLLLATLAFSMLARWQAPNWVAIVTKP